VLNAAVSHSAVHTPLAVRAPITMQTHCVIETAGGTYLPAMLSPIAERACETAVAAVLSVVLADGEADELLSVGQQFTIWADVMVGDTLCGIDRIGVGVVSAGQPGGVWPAQGAGSRALA
jgi:hypothetical protein